MDPKMVDCLASIRSSVINRAGDFIDMSLDPGPRTIDVQNSVGIMFGDSLSSLKASQVYGVSTGGPAHTMDAVKYGDEIKAVDHVPVAEQTLQRALNTPDVSGRKLVLTIERCT